MTKQQIQENNLKMLTFLGYEKKKDFVNYRGEPSYIFVSKEYPKLHFYAVPDFSSDWNLLMRVLEKICKTKVGDGIATVMYSHPITFGMLNQENEFMVRLNGFPIHSSKRLELALYDAMLEFIDFYNTLKK